MMFANEPMTAAEVWERARAVQQRLVAQRKRTRWETPTIEEVELPKRSPLAGHYPYRVLLDVVSERCRIPVDVILSDVRLARVNRARQIVMYLAFTILKHSKSEIGRQLDRDHSSVFHGILKISEAIDYDESLFLEIEASSAKAKERLAQAPWTNETYEAPRRRYRRIAP
jgi:chromosomal replication initiation ATPase DnaA